MGSAHHIRTISNDWQNRTSANRCEIKMCRYSEVIQINNVLLVPLLHRTESLAIDRVTSSTVAGTLRFRGVLLFRALHETTIYVHWFAFDLQHFDFFCSSTARRLYVVWPILHRKRASHSKWHQTMASNASQSRSNIARVIKQSKWLIYWRHWGDTETASEHHHSALTVPLYVGCASVRYRD